jgi:hypothetical protein
MSCYYDKRIVLSDEKLKELYYKEDIIIGSNQNASTKEINEVLKNQEINQVNKSQPST